MSGYELPILLTGLLDGSEWRRSGCGGSPSSKDNEEVEVSYESVSTIEEV
jgi:hypothetical protein